MPIAAIQLEKITAADLEQLVADGTSENKTVEYKAEWLLVDDPRKKEFLADVASFANTDGGDIVYGMKADKGVPTTLVGLDGFSADGEKLRAENLLAAWTKPRIAGVAFHEVKLKGGKSAFIVRVPRSWSGPHMTTYNNANRFLGRNSAGKFDLDVDQLRSGFLAGAKIHDRIRDFRLERISRIAGDDAGVALATKYRQVLHVMPLAELASYSPAQMNALGLVPMGRISSWGPRVNFDGYMVSATTSEGSSHSYVQLFRNGFIEAVVCRHAGQAGNMISPAYEGDIRTGLATYCQVLKKLTLEPPYVVSLSHVNVSGFMIAEGPAAYFHDQQPINKSNLLVPAAVLEATDEASRDAVLKEMADQVWHAVGRLGSPNFSKDGRWVGQQW